MPSIPAATVRALLAAFRALDLDAEAIRSAAGLAGADLAAVDGLLPLESFGRLFAEAARRMPHDELATEVGLSVPFGAFGALDYLAGSAATVGAAFHALAAHFRYVSMSVGLEIEEGPKTVEVRFVNAPWAPDPFVGDEFTVAVCVGRFRSRPGLGRFAVEAIRLTAPPPKRPTRHAALLKAPVEFGCRVAALRIAQEVWRERLPSADPALQSTLRQLAEHIGLGRPEEEDVIHEVRSRLRLLLPDGRADAGRVSRMLGVSERTLHRRLRAAGTAFREVLDRFREAEAERLLAAGTLSLAEVALRLGFSDQTAWNRAFRRWKGMPPREWSQSRGAR